MQAENILTTYEPHVCIVVYSITDRESFNKAEDTLQYLASQTSMEKMVIILVGNKLDQTAVREVSAAGKLMMSIKCRKTEQIVENMFCNLCQMVGAWPLDKL